MEIKLREVQEKDIDFIFELRNNEEVRKYMFNTEPLIYEKHVTYWRNRIEKKEPSYIIEKDEIKVGFVKLDYCNMEKSYYIGIVIEPKYQGEGLGKKTIEILKQKHGKLLAKVKPDNEKSKKMFESLGFKMRSYEMECD
jgi:RimJ/RimL family protein N-acetyltransferase